MISDRPRRGRPLVEEVLRLRVSDLRAPYGWFASRNLVAADGVTVKLRIEVEEKHGWLHVEHWRAGAAWASRAYDVSLISTPQPFGGRRWRFLCPEGFGACSTLFLPAGATRLASRRAHGLVFASQRLTSAGRAAARARRLVAALGGDGSKRPKGMHAATYERRRAELARLAEVLTARGIQTARGASTWTPIQVFRVLKATQTHQSAPKVA